VRRRCENSESTYNRESTTLKLIKKIYVGRELSKISVAWLTLTIPTSIKGWIAKNTTLTIKASEYRA